MNLIGLVSACVDLAQQAGQIIQDVHSSGQLNVKSKLDVIVDSKVCSDLQTEADRRAESLIVSSLRKKFPELIVIGEEERDGCVPSAEAAVNPRTDLLDKFCSSHQVSVDQFSLPSSSEVVVWVDPLDGTGEYAKGNLVAVTTLIGISVNGVATAGVIQIPFASPSPRTIWGIVGVGLEGLADLIQPRNVPRDQFLSPKPVVATSRNRRHPRADVAIASLGLTAEAITEVRVGAAGYHGLCIAQGKTDVWFSLCDVTKRWDICATDAVLQCCGGSLTDTSGKPYDYSAKCNPANTRGVVASVTTELHSKVLSTILPALAPYPDEDVNSDPWKKV